MRRAWFSLLALAWASGCVKPAGPDVCPTREEGCACSPSPPTCAEGLVCVVGSCVPESETGETSPGETGSTEETGGGTGTGGGSLDCFGGDCAPPDVGCEPGQGCYPQADGFICAAAGKGVPGDACEFVNDCVAGSACFVGDQGLLCTALCTEDADCAPDATCHELASAAGCVCG